MFFATITIGQTIEIKLQDGTAIKAGTDGITIEKKEKSAKVDFDTINLGRNESILSDINDLDVENVVYLGDDELVGTLRNAMIEQFESQRESDGSIDKSFQYQEALKLFEQAYFPEGITCASDWNSKDIDQVLSKTLEGTNSNLSHNKITGRNAFSPFIEVNYGKDGEAEYQLTLQKGKFASLGNGNSDVQSCKNAIDVTRMSKNEIMDLVRQMLSMTNEEVLEQYKPRIIDDRIILALILDDEIQRHLESTSAKAIETSYGSTPDIIHYSIEGGRNIRISEVDEADDKWSDNKFSIILNDIDEIQITVDNDYNYAKDGELTSIRITDLQEKGTANDELHKRIVHTLQNRFMNKKLEEKGSPLQQEILNLIAKEGRSGLTQQAKQNIIENSENKDFEREEVNK